MWYNVWWVSFYWVDAYAQIYRARLLLRPMSSSENAKRLSVQALGGISCDASRREKQQGMVHTLQQCVYAVSHRRRVREEIVNVVNAQSHLILIRAVRKRGRGEYIICWHCFLAVPHLDMGVEVSMIVWTLVINVTTIILCSKDGLVSFSLR